jgi:hypothetical protein
MNAENSTNWATSLGPQLSFSLSLSPSLSLLFSLLLEIGPLYVVLIVLELTELHLSLPPECWDSKQNKTKQNKTKQNKTKQNRCVLPCLPPPPPSFKKRIF